MAGRRKQAPEQPGPNKYAEQPRTQRIYVPHKDPWMPADYGDAEVQAIQALFDGRATAEQQRLGMKWIVEAASNYPDISFRPGGLEGARAADFNEGRRFVGAQCLKMRYLNLAAIRRTE